jgi:cytochrome d ubiquinol oxidase subunit I
MTDLLAARSQMAMSLGFHIVFAAIGIAMPLMMVLAEWTWLRTGHAEYLSLARRWATGSAILFAVGAVSGTVLSFELGLLWPNFMAWAGGAIGLLFSLEGFAFFTEAIFLGIYLYGWKLVSPWTHVAAGVLVVVSGIASALFVVAVNGWMNTPAGITLADGRIAGVDPLAVMFNPSAIGEGAHMVLAAFIATGFLVAGIHAWQLLKDPGNVFHRRACALALLVGGIPAVLQPLSGDLLAKHVAHYQPTKLAAFEAHFHTQAGAPFHIGGIPDSDTGTVPYSIEIPNALSLLVYHDPHAVVTGLDRTPKDLWPPVAVVHLAFQIMVGSGFALTAVALWGAWRWWRHEHPFRSRPFLWAVAAVSPLGFLAIEAGWVVTEVGRQPWIISGIMRTAEAVTPMPGLVVPLTVFTAVYLVLGGVVIWLIGRHVAAIPHHLGSSPAEGKRHAIA